MQTERKSRRLDPTQKTIGIGIRVPSRMDWLITKITRDLVAEGYDASKSQLIRHLIEDGIERAKIIYRAKHSPKYPDTNDR